MTITEAKAVIEANGQNIYFTSIKDARKVYKFFIDYYHAHHRKVDFKRPRLIHIARDKAATFIAVVPEETSKA
jgi:hypothetical protein